MYSFKPIGHLTTPFKEKFGVPRQSMMMSEARGFLKLYPEPRNTLALRNLEQFSHVWILFVFPKNRQKAWNPLIETPRLDAMQRMGVFATRSPDRPNPVGMSALKLESIDFHAADGIEIHLSGLDILDGTPVLDIKPYVPYADCLPEANSGWIQSEIQRYPVTFSVQSLQALRSLEQYPHLQKLIIQMLELDPRPTSQKRSAPIMDSRSIGLKFAFRVLHLDIHWEIRDVGIWVDRLIDCSSSLPDMHRSKE
jgi:tRNA-Thr(GGU) m(6)t(6)A37 methyltransferase TsaA